MNLVLWNFYRRIYGFLLNINIKGATRDSNGLGGRLQKVYGRGGTGELQSAMTVILDMSPSIRTLASNISALAI